MIEVSVEVGNGTAHFSLTVRAESIRGAIRIVEDRYPGSDVRVAHPIDPEAFFVKGPTAAAELVELQMTKSVVV